jgi:hypothetical protein
MSFVKVNRIIELRQNGDVFFECPFCWSEYKKNGEPRKKARKKFHSIVSIIKNYPEKIKDDILYIDTLLCDPDRFPIEKFCGFSIVL